MNIAQEKQLVRDLSYILQVMKSGRAQKAYDLLEVIKNQVDFSLNKE